MPASNNCSLLVIFRSLANNALQRFCIVSGIEGSFIANSSIIFTSITWPRRDFGISPVANEFLFCY